MRDVAVLQVKLLIDGLRDLILVPASLVAAVWSLIDGDDGKPGAHFYRLLSLGKKSERWISLFGTIRKGQAELAEANNVGDADIDQFVSRIEAFVVEEHRRGGVTAQAKARIDRALDSLQRSARSGG
jgi:hypothetical protein